MSNSPKYTTIDFSAERAAAERAAARQRAAERRQRQAARAAEFQRRQAERAAEFQRRQAERAAEFQQREAGRAAESRRQRTQRADQASAARSTADAALGRETEDLRARARNRDTAAVAQAREERQRIITGLAGRLASPGPSAARLEPDRYARCTELLRQLEAAADDGVRFDVLHGTVEHEVASYAERASSAVHAAEEALTDAEDRLATTEAAARSAAGDARALGDEALARELGDAVDGVVAALLAARADPGRAGAALEAATGLDDLLSRAEERLDELTLAYERRGAFAEALKGVLAEQGMSFLSAKDTGGRFILQFERPGGALYTAAVDDGEGDDLRLSYAIDGEADIPVLPEPGAEAACDQTEAFLETIHDDLVESGYEADELSWAGKPSGTRPPRKRHIRAGRAIRSRGQA